MKGWLLYDKQGAARNEWFIRRLQTESEALGMRLSLRITDGNERFEGEDLPSFAIVRFVAPQINARLQSMGVRVFNNAETARVACDKWETYAFCKQWQIPVLPTERWERFGGTYPCVIKSRDGHGGTEVFWINSEQEAQKAVSPEKRYIAQEPNDVLGVDTRVYVLGGKVLAAVKRTSERDFKSNYSLGGNVSLTSVTEEQRGIVDRVYRALGCDFVGIDFLPHAGGVVLNEIEDAAGTRMLYRCSDIDAAGEFVRYIRENV